MQNTNPTPDLRIVDDAAPQRMLSIVVDNGPSRNSFGQTVTRIKRFGGRYDGATRTWTMTAGNWESMISVYSNQDNPHHRVAHVATPAELEERRQRYGA